MTDSSVQNSEDSVVITPQDVLAFLKCNPQFLKEHPQALEHLIPPKPRKEKGGVADFQSYMIERLRADKEQVLDTAQSLVETARNNMNNQQRVHTAVLRLLEAQDFSEFINIITVDLGPMLGTDLSVFVVEADGQSIPHIQTSGIRVLPQGTIDRWMENKNYLLQSDIHGSEAIYGGGATLVRSQALLRVDISMQTPPAILAFGSRDPEMFTPGQATDQVSFLARVVERVFRSWLDLP